MEKYIKQFIGCRVLLIHMRNRRVHSWDVKLYFLFKSWNPGMGVPHLCSLFYSFLVPFLEAHNSTCELRSWCAVLLLKKLIFKGTRDQIQGRWDPIPPRTFHRWIPCQFSLRPLKLKMQPYSLEKKSLEVTEYRTHDHGIY